MLEVQGIVKRFGGNLVVNGVSFQVCSGQLTALIGPNGAGKTTILDIISGFTPQDSGSVFLNEMDVSHLSPWKRASGHITRTFQHLRDIKALTCLQSVQLRFRGQIGNDLLPGIFMKRKWSRQEQATEDRARRLLADVMMEDCAHKPTASLFLASASYSAWRERWRTTGSCFF